MTIKHTYRSEDEVRRTEQLHLLHRSCLAQLRQRHEMTKDDCLPASTRHRAVV